MRRCTGWGDASSCTSPQTLCIFIVHFSTPVGRGESGRHGQLLQVPLIPLSCTMQAQCVGMGLWASYGMRISANGFVWEFHLHQRLVLEHDDQHVSNYVFLPARASSKNKYTAPGSVSSWHGTGAWALELSHRTQSVILHWWIGWPPVWEAGCHKLLKFA